MRKLIDQTTQQQFWRFTADRLDQIRQETRQSILERFQKEREEERELLVLAESSTALEPAHGQEGEPPTVQDQLDLCCYYEERIHVLCKTFQFPYRVQATATVYFKRFYLLCSVLEFHPKDISVTCVFLATKSENHYISIDRFVQPIPKLETKTVLDLEFILIDTLKFHLAVHHPYLPLHGIFLDAQAYISDYESLLKSYHQSIEYTHEMYHTDACFLYPPSQIAMALFVIAADEQIQSESGRDAVSFLDAYVKPRFEQEPAGLSQLLTAIAEIQRMYENRPKADKARAIAVDKRLKQWKLPSQDSNTHLYQKLQEQLQNEAKVWAAEELDSDF